MTRMTGPDCAVMCNLINTHTLSIQEKTVTVQKELEKATSPKKKRKENEKGRKLL